MNHSQEHVDVDLLPYSRHLRRSLAIAPLLWTCAGPLDCTARDELNNREHSIIRWQYVPYWTVSFIHATGAYAIPLCPAKIAGVHVSSRGAEAGAKGLWTLEAGANHHRNCQNSHYYARYHHRYCSY